MGETLASGMCFLEVYVCVWVGLCLGGCVCMCMWVWWVRVSGWVGVCGCVWVCVGGWVLYCTREVGSAVLCSNHHKACHFG